MPDLSRRALQMQPSPISAQLELARSMIRDGKPVIDLTAGETHLPVPDMIKDAAISAVILDKTGYTTSHGTAELRSVLAEKYRCGTERIAVSNGAKTVLAAVMQCILDPGDDIILPAPYWSCFSEMIRMAGGNPVIVPCEEQSRYLLTPGVLESSLTAGTKAVILNTPCNPSGQIYSGEELSALMSVCRRHGLFLILDGSYSELTFSGPACPLDQFSGDDLDSVIYVASASKSYAMSGWRLGWSVASAEVTSALAGFFSNCTGCPSALAQAGLEKALKTDLSAPESILAECSTRCSYVASRVNKTGFLTCLAPQGGLYVLAKLEEGTDDLSFSVNLLREALVAVVPGTAFGLPGHIRIACTRPLPELEEAMDRVERFVRNPACF